MGPERCSPCFLSLTAASLLPASVWCCGLPALRAAPEPPRVVINEILAWNVRTNRDDDGDGDDWIELFNPGSGEVDLAGCTLSDDESSPRKWAFPAIRIAAGGHLLVWASGKDRSQLPIAPGSRLEAEPAFDRRLVRPGDAWRYLIAVPGADGPAKDWAEATFDDSALPEGPSGFGYADGDDATLVPEGTTAVFLRRKIRIDDPLALGQLVLRIDYDDGFVAYLNGARVAAANSPVEHPDFNTTASDKHEMGAPEHFDLTPHLGRLRAGENVIAIAGLNDTPSTDMSLIPELATLPLVCHASFRLRKEGGGLFLRSRDGALLDSVAYPPQAEDRSYGRSADGGASWSYFLTPTPARANTSRPLRQPPLVALRFTPVPGLQPDPLQVRLEAESNVEGIAIRYTTDGTEPGAESPAATEPIPIARTTVFRAAGFLGSERATPVASASYFVGAASPLPALSLSVDPEHFQAVHLQANAHGATSERPAYMEVLDASGKRIAATAFGLRLHGGYGRKGGLETKKSYRAYFRRRYGSPRLAVPFLEGEPAGGCDKLVLRAGFNDRLGAYHAGATCIRDQVIRDLHRDMGALTASGAWCVVHVNGQSIGLYNLTERFDGDFLEAHLPGEGDWDLIKTGNVAAAGTRQGWDSLRAYIAESDLSRPDPYAEILRRIDVEGFTAYVILNLWAQNDDWPQNNWYAARRRTDGSRWVFLSWDAEWGLGHTPSGYQASSIRSMLSRKGPVRDLFAALCASAEYRAFFKKESARHLEGALRPENVLKHIARHSSTVEPVIARELRRWAPGFPVAAWKRNVKALEVFAARRGEHFARLVEEPLVPQVPRDPALDRPAILPAGLTAGGEIRVIHRGEDGAIEELRGRPGGPWRRSRRAPGAGIPSAAGRPALYLDAGGKALHAVYRGGDGHLHDVLLDGDTASQAGARAVDLTEAARAPPAAGDPEAIFWDGDASPHVVYRGPGGLIHELWLAGDAWHHLAIPISAGSPRTAGEPCIYARPHDRTHHVLYPGEDGHVHQVWVSARSPGAGQQRQWQHTDLTKTVPAPAGAAAVAGVAGPGRRQRIVYRDASGTLHGLDFEPQRGWTFSPLGASPAAGLPCLAPGPAGGAGRVIFRGPDASLNCLSLDGSAGDEAFSQSAGAPAAATDPHATVDPATGHLFVTYRGVDGHVHLLRLDGEWRLEDLTRASGATGE